MKWKTNGKRFLALLLTAVLLLSVCPVTASAEEEVPAAVQAFLNAVKQIQIPSEINEETVEVFAEQIRTAFDAYEELSAEEIQRDDVQQASITLQNAVDAQSGGINTMALLTGEEFSIVVNVGYIDDNGNFVRTGSKTMVSTCRYGCGHSGYNHTMNAQEIVNASGYTGNSWRVTRYGYWDDPSSTTTVNYNITGSAPYKADQAIWVIGDKPTVDEGNSGGDGNGEGTSGNQSENINPEGTGNYRWTQTLVYHANYPGDNDPQITVVYNVKGAFGNMTVATITPKTFAQCGFTVPEGYQLKANSWYSASTGGTVLCSMGGAYSLNYANKGTTIHLYAQYTPTQAPINTISLTYDAQGGKVEGKDTHTISISTTDKSYSFQSLEPVWDGYNFLGWYDGTSDNAHKISWPYTLSLVGSATSISKTVYAKWEKQSDTHEDATIIYQNGGGSGGPVTETVSGSAEYIIKAPGDVGITAPEGKVFSHWANGDDIYFPGDAFYPKDGSTNIFVAVWKDDDSETGNATYTVSWYDSDGNSIKTTETRKGTLNMPVSVTEADKTVIGYIFNETDSRNVLQAVLEEESGTELKLYFTKDENYVPISKAGDSTMNITKEFVGIDSAPDGFQLNYSYTDLATNQVVTGTVALTGTGDTLTGTLSLPYYHNVATGETYTLTITEQNADVNGYTMEISGSTSMSNINQQAHSFQYAISATTESTLNRTITNTYTKNQSSTNWSGLAITKTASPSGTVTPGDTITYTITVENKTGKDLKNVTVSEELDTNLTFVSATPSNDQYDNGTGLWKIDTLADNATATLTIKATVKDGVAAGTTIGNTATITAAKTDDDETLPEDDQPADSVDITVKPDEPVKPDWDELTIAKSANPEAVKRGETITYTILVKNNTGVKLDTVTVQETPDSNLTVTGYSQGAAYDAKNNVWTITGLENGAKATLTVTATVNTDTTASVVWNTASITSASAEGGETLTGNPSDSISVVVTDPNPIDPEPETDWDGLTLKKTANRSSVRPGKTITYTLTVTNKTGKDLTDIVVSEKLDTNLTFVSSSGDGKYDVKTGEWTIGKLENGGKATLTLKATVKTGLKDGTVIKNTACITDADAENGDTLPTDAQPSGSAKVTVSNKISLIPETGDTSNIGLWIGVLVACAVVLGVVLILTVKKKKTR